MMMVIQELQELVAGHVSRMFVLRCVLKLLNAKLQ